MTTNIDLTQQTAAQVNAQRLREAFEAFDRGDLDHLRNTSADNATWTNAGSSPIAGTYHGWDEIQGMLFKLFELTGGTFKTRVQSVLSNDHESCAIYDATATVNGKTDTQRFIVLDTYNADGKVQTTDVVAFNQEAADALFG